MNKYNTLYARFFALILDSILLLPLGILSDWNKDFADAPVKFQIVKIFIYLAGFFYVVLMHYFFGQTVGKMLMKVKVLDLSEKPISFFQSALRDLPQFLSIFIFVIFGDPDFFINQSKNIAEFAKNPVANSFYILLMIYGLTDIIVFFTNEKRRALHDYIARTVVVRVETSEV